MDRELCRAFLRRALPFRGRELTCGTGIHLKMAITRWSNWATDAGMRDLTSSGCGPFLTVQRQIDQCKPKTGTVQRNFADT